MELPNRRDAGQAFPIYIVMVAGLLFLAFAFFAVGQASATRNGAQGAADAAALAAAQEARDGLTPPLLQALREPNGLNEFLATYQYFQAGRGQAMQLASDNRSNVIDFYWRPGYWQDKVTARIETRYTVGDSVIPGTENKRATATATAVIEFRCSPKVKGVPATGPGDDDGAEEGGEASLPIVTLDCDGRDVPIDLGASDPLAGLSKLIFAVHLIDD
ncbi:pilus assembly protein TadG-related protein [Streptomyces sp. NBC_00385]|uniref:pilus assembly protein TadG-related protein n=1 Tax=Streptomyces sp. NBC_00385 TaxID=2975733 RepID=UPI002DDC0778|nr:pilus assembly protein TadG-related protein [Streptomyces sp. NBC_00385]WRZ04198.1 pilus assembly protein TadG-related protein [Streptomyces sp. NBC_00385]